MGVGTWIKEQWVGFTDPHGTKAFVKEQMDAYHKHAVEALANPTKEALDAAAQKTRESAAAIGGKVDKLKMTALENEFAKVERNMLEGGIVRRSVKRSAKFMKYGAFGVAGAAALGLIVSSLRSGKSEQPAPGGGVTRADLEELKSSMAMNQMAMASGPAEGRAPNEWRERVGGAAPAMAAQPVASVADNATDLGAIAPTR